MPRRRITGNAISSGNLSGTGQIGAGLASQLTADPFSGNVDTGAAPAYNEDPYSAANPWGSGTDPGVDTGGGGSGGGSGGGAVYDYTTDPTYAAYVAALDLDQAQRQATTSRQRDYLMSDQTRLLDQTAQQGEQSREGISGGYESRGLFNSGGRLRDISRQQSNQASREGSIRENATRGVAELEAQMANYLAQAQLKRQSAQLGSFQ